MQALRATAQLRHARRARALAPSWARARSLARPPASAPAPAPAPAPRQSLAAAVGLVGFGAGTLGSLAGIGGAVFTIPGLVRFASLKQRVAAGNSLIAVSFIAISSTLTFAEAGAVDWPVACVLAGSASLLTPVGAYCSTYANPAVLRKGLGGFLLLLAPTLPLQTYAKRVWETKREEGQKGVVVAVAPVAASSAESTVVIASTSTSSVPEPPVSLSSPREIHRAIVNMPTSQLSTLSLSAAMVGFCSGLLGISGGTLFTPLIAFAAGTESYKTVLGTSFAAMVVPSAIGAASYAKLGLVRLPLVPPLVAGGVVGAYIGSSIALKAPEEYLRLIFSAVFSVLGFRIMRAPLRPRTTKPNPPVTSPSN